jgi:hypothetical protein
LITSACVVESVVERYEDRRRGDGVRVRLTQPIEARAKLLVEDRDRAIEGECARRQLRDGGRDAGEAACVVAPVVADQADALAVLVGEDAPPVDLLLRRSSRRGGRAH